MGETGYSPCLGIPIRTTWQDLTIITNVGEKILLKCLLLLWSSIVKITQEDDLLAQALETDTCGSNAKAATENQDRSFLPWACPFTNWDHNSD